MQTGIRSILRLAACVALGFMSVACGNSNGMITVRLVPAGLGSSRPLDLAKNLASPNRAYVGKCTQRNLVAGVDPTPESNSEESLLETVRIPIQTDYDNAGDYTIDAAWMLSRSSPVSVELRVPKGSPVAIGILGTLVSARSAFNGLCDEIDPATKIPYPGSSVLGYRTQVFNETQDVVMPVWIVPARTGFAPRPPTAAGNPGCDIKGTSEFCPERAFLGAECFFCPMTPLHHLRLTYAFDRNGKPPVTQFLPGAAFASGLYTHIPDMFPMRIEVLAVQSGVLSPIPGYVWDAQRTAFQNNGTNGQRWATRNFIAAGAVAPSGESLKLVEYPQKVPPTIGAFSLTGTIASGTTFPFTWSAANNATYYEVYDTLSNFYGTTNGTSFSINTTSFNGGTTYTFIVKAYNNDGSTPVQSSNTVIYTHIKWMPLPTSSIGPSGGAFTVLNGLSAGGTTHNLICNRIMGTGNPTLNFPVSNSTQTISGGLTSGDQYSCSIQATNASFGNAQSPPFPATVL